MLKVENEIKPNKPLSTKEMCRVDKKLANCLNRKIDCRVKLYLTKFRKRNQKL